MSPDEEEMKDINAETTSSVEQGNSAGAATFSFEDLTPEQFSQAKELVETYEGWRGENIWKLPYFKTWFTEILLNITPVVDVSKLIEAKEWNSDLPQLDTLLTLSISKYFDGKFDKMESANLGGLQFLASLNRKFEYKKMITGLEQTDEFFKSYKKQSRVERTKQLEILSKFDPKFGNIGPVFSFLSVGPDNLHHLCSYIIAKFGGTKTMADFTTEEAENVVADFRKERKKVYEESKDSKEFKNLEERPSQSFKKVDYLKPDKYALYKEVLSLFKIIDPIKISEKRVETLPMPIDSFVMGMIKNMTNKDRMVIIFYLNPFETEFPYQVLKLSLQIPSSYPARCFTSDKYPTIKVLNTDIPKDTRDNIEAGFQYIVATALGRRKTSEERGKPRDDFRLREFTVTKPEEGVEGELGQIRMLSGNALYGMLVTLNNNLTRFLKMDQDYRLKIKKFMKSQQTTNRVWKKEGSSENKN